MQNLLTVCHNLAESLESQPFYQRLANSSSSPPSPSSNFSLKSDWTNSHLANLDMETRLTLQTYLSSVFPTLTPLPPTLDKDLLKLLQGPQDLTLALLKGLILSTLRLYQSTSILSQYLGKGLGRIDQAYDESMHRIREECNNRIKILGVKIDKVEKVAKGVKELAGGIVASPGSKGAKGEKGEKGTTKSGLEKEVERLKVRIVALEKQNSFLVGREKDLETKLKESPKVEKKEKKREKEGKGSKEKDVPESPAKSSKSVLLVMDPPVSTPTDQTDKKKGKKVVVSKQEKQDRFETTLMDICSLLSSAMVSGPLPSQLFLAPVYSNFMEAIVEVLPKADKKKDVLADKSGWFKGLLEIAVRMIDHKHRVKWSEEQELICIPDPLPIKFNPKSTFWIRILDPKNLDMVPEAMEPMSKFIVQEQVTKKLLELTNSFANYFRIKIAECSDKLLSMKIPSPDLSQPFTGTPVAKGTEIKLTLKKLKETIQQKAILSKSLICCYLFIERLAVLASEQKIYLEEEIEEIINEKYWRDVPLAGQEVKSWYLRLRNGVL